MLLDPTLAPLQAAYFGVSNTLVVLACLVILVSSLDDLFIDAYYWIRAAYRAWVIRRRYPRLTAQALRSEKERWFAIMVPAWKEYAVLAQMIEHTIAVLEYRKFVIFVGTYQNDPDTTIEADRMVRRYPNVLRRATVHHDGPTCKADCLNWIIQSILAYEEEHAMRFAGIAMHDCEDIIHPLELNLFNHLIERKDFLQLPVLSLERNWNDWVGGTYLDDFSEWHSKDLVVRESLTGCIPGAGVASCYSRRIIERLLEGTDNQPFCTDSLTEDYDTSFQMKRIGAKMAFVWLPLEYKTARRHIFGGQRREIYARSIIATRELFPGTFRAAYRQRARWIIGIAFQGAKRLGWQGSLATKYMYLRDRKGTVTSLVTILAYVLLLNHAAQRFAIAHGWLPPGQTLLEASPDWLADMMFVNTAMLGNRVLQRVYFVARLNGLRQGLLSIPRLVVNNFINFFAVCRAWRLFITSALTGEPIGWDKTKHSYPSREDLQLVHRRLGELLLSWHAISRAQLDDALVRQKIQTDTRLGELLISGAGLDAGTLADAVAWQAGLPRVELSHRDWRPFAARLPSYIEVRHRAIPFGIGEAAALNVAVSAPLAESALAQLRAAAGVDVQCFIASDPEVAAALSELQSWIGARADLSKVD
ncbi:general secretion pathway protein E [Burkholderia aenigmatica]|uniref:General secretion pathway protein E n=1 Tax=Burkholderia aenigmatica TaxID=2015348 RepID=A0ABY6XSI5_9BURK|nr:glycosyl transferase family protein [Burkholderia aenigmatica]VWC73701.1 general secretion pathway protein E [Burkholderia aenigmatica]